MFRTRIALWLFEFADWLLPRLPPPLRDFATPIVEQRRKAFAGRLLHQMRAQVAQLRTEVKQMRERPSALRSRTDTVRKMPRPPPHKPRER